MTATQQQRPLSRFSVAIAVVSLLACGDESSSAADDTAANTRAATAASAAIGTDSVSATPPLLLAAACLAGDHVEGTHRSLEGVVAGPLAIRSIAALASRDSARLAARISRTVDVLPSDTSVADFRGLPVSVRAAWSLVPVDGDTVIVASVARRVPIESAPLEEIFTIIAAPGERQGVRDPLIEQWVVRDVGREEELPGRELAGAYVHEGVTILVLAHDAPAGSHATLVARRDGRWRSEWTGPIGSCAAPPVRP